MTFPFVKHHIIIIIIIIIITFILIQEKGFTEPLLNWKTSALPFLYVITQTLETVNVNLELDYLHLLKKISITTLSLYNLHDGYKFDIMYKGSA